VFSGSGGLYAEDKDSTYTNSIGMEFVLIPAGIFMMGADKNIEEPYDQELPSHKVKISKPFYLGIFEVTQQQWADVMGDQPSMYKGKDNPVEMVNWEDVQEFITRLNQKEGHSRYRLPTEAEWEYAARAGSTSAYYFGNDGAQLADYAWFADNSSNSTHPVGQKRPNAWGLHDMLGNVWEWLGDRFNGTYYENSPFEDPSGPTSGTRRVLRGSSFGSSALQCQTTRRLSFSPALSSDEFGFRLALSVEDRK
jgi:formylglycine-generating enzyme required for sulfatase activity